MATVIHQSETEPIKVITQKVPAEVKGDEQPELSVVLTATFKRKELLMQEMHKKVGYVVKDKL